MARRIAIIAVFGLVILLYLVSLAGIGMVSTDEPRYADIGRAMAHTGDWITPRLWGHPWFEKPALLYWMIAAGFKLGLGDDVAPRLPVALLSIAFLAFFWWQMRALWDTRIALYATALLATSAGWLAYSRLSLTDVPSAVFFSIAILLSLRRERVPYAAIAAALGLAFMAKSLLPIGLFFPVVMMDFRRWRNWLRPGPILLFAAVALPWHILCLLRNGEEFPRVLFLQHQFGRLTSTEIQHVQQWWYYLPILLLLLFPWFPLLALIPRLLSDWRDRRIRIPLVTILFGLLFLSASVNKVAGYLLPLLPLICILMGVGLARVRNPAWATAVSVALLGFLPAVATILPAAVAGGLRSATFPPLMRLVVSLLIWVAASALVAGAIVFASGKYAPGAGAAVAAGSFLWFMFTVFPNLDRAASARSLWRSAHPACVQIWNRSVIYGLNYYANHELPPCVILDQLAPQGVR